VIFHHSFCSVYDEAHVLTSALENISLTNATEQALFSKKNVIFQEIAKPS
jgi:hypothetical protein